MRALHDGHGRSVRYLRLSVTDRCNLRCLYCRSNAKQRCKNGDNQSIFQTVYNIHVTLTFYKILCKVIY